MKPSKACRNCPQKWANDKGKICRACLRKLGDTRNTRQIQADEARRRDVA